MWFPTMLFPYTIFASVLLFSISRGDVNTPPESIDADLDYDRMMTVDFSEMFGIERGEAVDTEQLHMEYLKYQKKYRKLLTVTSSCHQKEVNDILIRIQEAYETMKDPDERRRYLEMSEMEPKSEDEQGPLIQIEFPIEHLLSYDRRRKLPELHVDLRLTIEQLAEGGSIKTNVKRWTICSDCKGSGAADNVATESCLKCSGAGVETRMHKSILIIQYIQTICSDCRGSGEIISNPCPGCLGKKITSVESEHEVDIPAGMWNGASIVIPEIGNEYPGMVTGDAVFEVEELPHPRFSRKNADIYVTETLDLLEALRGFDKTISDPSGRLIHLKRSGITQNGDTDVFPRRGMPILQVHKGKFVPTTYRGDFHVTYKVVLPTTNVEISRRSDGSYHLEL